MSGEMSSTYVKIERGENSDEYVPFREDIDTYFVAKPPDIDTYHLWLRDNKTKMKKQATMS